MKGVYVEKTLGNLKIFHEKDMIGLTHISRYLYDFSAKAVTVLYMFFYCVYIYIFRKELRTDTYIAWFVRNQYGLIHMAKHA